MKNLFLPEINYNEPPEINIPIFTYWSLNGDILEEYRYLANVFTDQECAEIIKLGKQFPVDQSKTADNKGFSEVRKSKNSWIPPCELSNWVYIRIQDAINEVNKHFQFDLHSIENLQFTEYHNDYKGYYDKHIDKYANAPSPGSHRKLSFSIQLTDPCEYEGGDLLIYNGGKPITANKSKGTINFFPSYTLHEVTPVTKGKRFALVSWIHGPKFK